MQNCGWATQVVDGSWSVLGEAVYASQLHSSNIIMYLVFARQLGRLLLLSVQPCVVQMQADLAPCAVCERATQHCLCNDVFWWVWPWLVSSSSFPLNELFERRSLFAFGQIERFRFSWMCVSVSVWMCTCHYCLYPFDSSKLYPDKIGTVHGTLSDNVCLYAAIHTNTHTSVHFGFCASLSAASVKYDSVCFAMNCGRKCVTLRGENMLSIPLLSRSTQIIFIAVLIVVHGHCTNNT